MLHLEPSQEVGDGSSLLPMSQPNGVPHGANDILGNRWCYKARQSGRRGWQSSGRTLEGSQYRQECSHTLACVIAYRTQGQRENGAGGVVFRLASAPLEILCMMDLFADTSDGDQR